MEQVQCLSNPLIRTILQKRPQDMTYTQKEPVRTSEQQDRLLGESFDSRTPVRNTWLTELFESRIAIYFLIIA